MFPRVILVALAAMLGVEHAHGLVALCDVGHERNPLLCLRYTNRWRRLTMTTIRSTRLGVLLSIAVFAGLGSTGAQAYDPIVRDHRTPGPVVRDHRGQNGAPQGGVTVTSSTRQRGSTPCIRNILGGPCIGLGWR